MNGYKKLKRLAGMRAVKAISAVTALSMTVTSLAVAASANSVTPDAISNLLGDLKNYGVVAESFTSATHFESNFAANKVTINNDSTVENYINNSFRKISLKISSDESFVAGETKRYYYGIFCEEKIIDVTINGSLQKGLLTVEFTEAGEKNFTVYVPDEYKYETLVIRKLDAVETDEGIQFTSSDEGTELVPPYDSKEDAKKKASSSIIGETFKVQNLIGEDKTINVCPDVYEKITVENDGRYSYNQGEYPVIFANSSNEFINDPNAKQTVDNLLATVKEASATLAKVERGGENVLFTTIDKSVDYGSEEDKTLNELYQMVKDNTNCVLLVNVLLGESAAFDLKFHGPVGNWDVETSSRIIFNLIGGVEGVTKVTLGDGFRGTVLSPIARVANESTIAGAIYAPEVTNPGGEIHRATYGSFVEYYEGYNFSTEETTTVAETTTTPEETTTPEITTTEEPTTTPEETTTTTTEETTTTPKLDDGTATQTTTPAPETTTTTPVPVVTTTPAPETTTTPAPVVTTTPAPETTTTTPAPVVTTTPAPETTTTPAPVVTTTPAPETTTTTPAPVVTTTPAPETTTTPAPVVTTTPAPETTTTPVPAVTTTPAPETTTATPEETTVPEETTAVTTTEEIPVITTTTIIIEEDVPRDELIIIEEDVPLDDTPFNTGVDDHIGLFIGIGCGALLLGVAAQVYTVILKKKN